MTKFSFLQISRKGRVLELRVVLSVYINMHIAVILSYKLTLYGLQKLRYGISLFAHEWKNGRGQKRVWSRDTQLA